MLLEKDGDKLGYRLPVDIDDTDRDADLTADWVITGPDVTSFRDDLVEAFDSISIREQVAEVASRKASEFLSKSQQEIHSQISKEPSKPCLTG